MSLRAALHERALLGAAFGHRRPRIARTPQPRPARYAHAAQMAYLRGLLAFVGVIQDAITRHVLAQLPRLVAAHAASQPRIDAGALEPRRRIAIIGAPRAGKTTLALELGALTGLPVHSSDDLIALGWSEASSAAADLIEAGAATGGIFEGVAVIRALRKLLRRRPDKPVDAVMIMHLPRTRLTSGQAAMAAGVRSIVHEVLPEMQARGVDVYHDEEMLRASLSSPARTDEADDDVDRLFSLVSNDVEAQVTDGHVSLLAQQNALRVSEHVKGEVETQIKRVVAIDLNAPDTGVPQHVRNFVAQQITLVKGLKAQTLAKTHSVVLEGIRQGLRSEEIAKQLREQVGLSKNRATIIANDQIGKLHGELTRLRQTSLGIKRYRWATSRDELVRPSHRALEGTTQSWDSPPVVNAKTGKRAHPGFDTHFYPCRCSAIPIIDDLLEEAGLVTVPPPAPPANTNTAANQNAAPKRLRAKPPPPLPPEHTPQHWLPLYEPEYKGAAPQLAWGRAMAERGRALSLEDLRAGADKLRKNGIEIADPDNLLYVREIVAQAKPRSVAELLDALAADPDISNVRRAVAREIELTSKLVAHHRALSTSKKLKRITLRNRIRLSTRNVTRERVDAARRRARTIFEAMSSSDLRHPVDYEWQADAETRGVQFEPTANARGMINLGASRPHVTDDQLTSVILHEWAHALEALNDKRLEAAVDFLEARAGTEQPRRLNEILNSTRYNDDELAIRDRLYNSYMGKQYKAGRGNRQNVRGLCATEVTSMAVQDLHDVTRLASKIGDSDPDALDWLLGQLADQ